MKLFLLEFNEFNEQLLRSCCQVFSLPNIEKLFLMHRSEITTEDTYESDFLEPWVQWVCVHTGKSSSEHKIKHLGDVPDLSTEQIWEVLSGMGISSGVWLAMNSSRKNAPLCKFFLPDPWTASERAFPESLNQLLDPLRFVSKNYLGLAMGQVFRHLKGLIQLITSCNEGWDTVKQLPIFLLRLIKFKGAHFVFITFVELLSTRLFLSFKKRFNPDFSVLFINSLAHIQHHYWTDFDYKNNPRIEIGLKTIDKILGLLMASLDSDEALVVTNALSQKNTNDEEPWILYRPYDTANFLAEIDIFPKQIECCMTHDAFLFFENQQQCQKASKILQDVKINGFRFFLVEEYKENPTKLFFRIDFTDQVAPDDVLLINNKEIKLLSFFKAIVQRTGKHIPEGTVFSSVPIPKQMMNREVFSWIVKYFSKQS